MSWFPIQTARLLLREFVPGDFEDVHALTRDPEVARHSSWGPLSEEETKAWLAQTLEAAQTQARTVFEVAVTLRENPAHVIGTAHLSIRDRASREGVLGYSFHRGFWGQGYATEAASALLRLAFTRLDLHRVCATASPENTGSHRVLEKIGMQREGTLRQNVWLRDHWRDSVLYAMVEADWDERAEAQRAGVGSAPGAGAAAGGAEIELPI
jgi:ribosomal-protein-alanine N-acetyltransferase